MNKNVKRILVVVGTMNWMIVAFLKNLTKLPQLQKSRQVKQLQRRQQLPQLQKSRQLKQLRRQQQLPQLQKSRQLQQLQRRLL
jgi:hypothetical protein